MTDERKAALEHPAEVERDVPTIRIVYSKKMGVNIGVSSILGTRQSQQDSVYGFGEDERAIAVVCDGMGGLSGGEIASQIVVENIAKAWMSQKEIRDVPAFLHEEAKKADSIVYHQTTEDGERLNAGTTIVMVMIQGDKLHWLSVGDSRIYVIRGQEILAVNRPHNYRVILEEKLARGDITEEDYAREEHKAEALTSYLGMGNMTLMDINREPFQLESKDLILLCSDGLYRSLTEADIMRILIDYREDVQLAAEQLTAEALGEKTSGQDNTSVILLEFYQQNIMM